MKARIPGRTGTFSSNASCQVVKLFLFKHFVVNKKQLRLKKKKSLKNWYKKGLCVNGVDGVDFPNTVEIKIPYFL